MLWMLGSLLASCGPAIKVVEKPVPVKVTPCHVGPMPVMGEIEFVGCTLDAEGNIPAACTSPQELSLLAAWVTAMADWVSHVKACPYVDAKPNLADALKAGDPYLKP